MTDETQTDEKPTENKAPKKKAPSKADLQAELDALKAQIAEQSPVAAPVDDGEKVLVICVCSNVHLGNGVVLRAKQNSKGNWKDGDTAWVSVAVDKLLIANETCEYV